MEINWENSSNNVDEISLNGGMKINIISLFSSVKGSYLSACLHYLAIFGSTAHVHGNTEHGGLNPSDAKLIQVNYNKVLVHYLIFVTSY